MGKINRNTILHRAPNLKLEINSSNQVAVRRNGAVLQDGPHTLAILDTFYQPVRLADALTKLQPRLGGSQDWIVLMATITRLHEAGVLLDDATEQPAFGSDGFAVAGVHAVMLNDRARTSSYLTAIREGVRPGDVVVDIGTGTGILATAAAQAGARHVYAIEASSMGKVARSVFEANGVADRVTVVQGWSTTVTLPERADVLVSEIIGNAPLAEGVLEVTTDAVKRLLKPGARLVPSKLRICGLPVTVPRARQPKNAISSTALRNWRSWYDIDFSPLAAAPGSSPDTVVVKPQVARRWSALSGPIVLAEVDFQAMSDLVIDNSVTVAASAPGRLNGVLVYFELELGPTTVLSTAPAQASRDNHWLSGVWLVKEPLSLKVRDRFAVSYRYRTANDGVAVVRA